MLLFIWRLAVVIGAGVLVGFASYKFFSKLERLELAILGTTEGGGLWIATFLGIITSAVVVFWLDYRQSCRNADFYFRHRQTSD